MEILGNVLNITNEITKFQHFGQVRKKNLGDTAVHCEAVVALKA